MDPALRPPFDRARRAPDPQDASRARPGPAHRPARLARVVATAALAIVVAACGSGGDPTRPDPTDGGPRDGGAGDGGAPGGCLAWQGLRTFGTPRTDEARGLLVDPDGATWVVGYEGGSRDDTVIPSGNARATVIRIAPDGTERTSAPFDLAAPHALDGLARAPDGRRLAFGRVRPAFAGAPIDPTRFDAITGWLGDDGVLAPGFRTGVVADDLPTGVAFDGADVWLAGYAEVRVDGGALVSTEDGFVARLRDGAVTRVDQESEVPDTLFAVDARAGDAVVAGAISVGPGRGAFVSRLDGRLAPRWTRNLSESPFDAATIVRFLDDGDALALGATFFALAGTPSAGGQDVFVARLDGTTGTPAFLAQHGGPDADWPTALAVAPDGTLVVAGETLGGIDAPPEGSFDVFVLGLAPDGARRFVLTLGSAGDDHPHAVAVDACGRVVVVGYSDGALPGQTPRGDRDAFVWAVDPP